MSKGKASKDYSIFYDLGKKYTCMEHYSGGPPECKICKNHDLRVLQLDHVNNDGKDRRLEMISQGMSISMTAGIYYYRWLVQNNYPHENLQVLCKECHDKKSHATNTRRDTVRNFGNLTISVSFDYANPIPFDIQAQPLWGVDYA